MQAAFSENPIYAFMAVGGTIIYVIKLLLVMFGADSDTDVDSVDHVDGGDSFSIVSVQSILAFFMGCGWLGLAAIREWNMEKLPALGVSALFGFLLMFLSAFLTFKIKKLNSIPTNNIQDAVGKTGKAYTKIPAKGEGIGQVEIAFGGKLQIMQAISLGEAIDSFHPVRVEQVDDSGNLLVKKS